MKTDTHAPGLAESLCHKGVTKQSHRGYLGSDIVMEIFPICGTEET
jgi:hypothetical protein